MYPRFLRTVRLPPAFWGCLLALAPCVGSAQETALDTVVVTAPRSDLEQSEPDRLVAHRANSSDSARLLQDIPGVSLYGAGGVSSLPALHGLADDRIRIRVDGMDLVAACPNHMNSALSYIDPAEVATVRVWAGITPVSEGGDSLGGTIQVNSHEPRFADAGHVLHAAELGALYRSNRRGMGSRLAAILANDSLHLSYHITHARADNYSAAGDFNPAATALPGTRPLPAREIGSSGYETLNQTLRLALRQAQHQVRLEIAAQHIPFEGFPNQRMDMTGNDSLQIQASYHTTEDWGNLQARIYGQRVDHAMNMGPDRYSYGVQGMPMLTHATTLGGSTEAGLILTERTWLRSGLEYQQHTLNDWWPPAGGLGMGPYTFWNINFGRRDRLGIFGELETEPHTDWSLLAGLRADTIKSDTGPVQGYNGTPQWANDAAAFNALQRAHTDHQWDATLLARFQRSPANAWEFGYARKSHSPNLYQRYAWSSNTMASLMNNFVGDGNGYLGNVGLKPEIAHTLSAGAQWQTPDTASSYLRFDAYLTTIADYIDVVRCASASCGGSANLDRSQGFVNLRYANHHARLYGLDISGQRELADTSYGTFALHGLFNYVRGRNTYTSDDLYHQMPANLKLGLERLQGGWRNTLEAELVAAKRHVSRVRNETGTPGYGLLHLRNSYQWPRVRLDINVENLLNRHYAPPLGGAYLGQGASMSSVSLPWGVALPGMGRSFNLSLTATF